jgi:DNA-binding response OmpR family regulator
MVQSNSTWESTPSNPHVIVVDDESSVRGLISRWITDAGYTCSQARDPGEALEILRARPIDAVTLDVRMPLGSGLDVVHQIAKEFPHVAILMATGVDDAQHAITALTQGACDYLIKPLDREMFLWRVRRAIVGRRRIAATSPPQNPSINAAHPVAARTHSATARAPTGPAFLARPQFAVVED